MRQTNKITIPAYKHHHKTHTVEPPKVRLFMTRFPLDEESTTEQYLPYYMDFPVETHFTAWVM